MKKFEMPMIEVQRLENENVISTSFCPEAHECKKCYCSAVTCDPVYSCSGLVCPGLD